MRGFALYISLVTKETMTDQEREQDRLDRIELEKRLTVACREVITALVSAEDFWKAMEDNHRRISILDGYWKSFRAEWFDPSCYR